MYITSTYSDIVHNSYIIHCYTKVLFPWQLSVDYFFCRKSFLPGIVSQNLIKMFNINDCFSDSFIPQYSYSYISLPTKSDHSRRVVVSYKRKYVHEVLVNCLFKLAQEKVWLGKLTVPQ